MQYLLNEKLLACTAYQIKLTMRVSVRLSRNESDSSGNICQDSKICTCILCYFKYVHRQWFASQSRLLEVYDPKDKQMFTKSLNDKFVNDAEEAIKFQQQFMMANGIICDNKRIQKRKSWRLEDSSARAFGTLEDLIYMWYNMDVTLPEVSCMQAARNVPKRHHPLPYLPESLRLKLYSAHLSNDKEARQFYRNLGAMPPHPIFTVELEGRPVELSMSIKIQTQNCRRVGIEVWKKYLDEQKSNKERLNPDEMKTEAVRNIYEAMRSELMPVYMRPKEAMASQPTQNLRGTSIRAHDLDYAHHHSDPGPYKMKKTVSGTVTRKSLIQLFEYAKMGPDSIFLDIGSGLGEPMITAATGFQVQLSLGLEVHKSRLEQSLRSIIDKGVSRAFPIHAGLEEICYLDPVTHVYCYTWGMDFCARNCIRESILSSRSVEYVMTDRKNMLRYDKTDNSGFEQVAQVTMGMAFAKAGTRTFYVLKRSSGNLRANRFHPIFALPLYTLRFDRDQEQAYLIKYLDMLSKATYRPIYFCSMKLGIGSQVIAKRQKTSRLDTGSRSKKEESLKE